MSSAAKRVIRQSEQRLLMDLDNSSSKSDRDFDNFQRMREWYEERYQCDWEEEKVHLLEQQLRKGL